VETIAFFYIALVYKMPKKSGYKKRGYAKKKSTGRRRLQPALATGAVVVAGAKIAGGLKRAYDARKARQTKATNLRARKNFASRMEASDNITIAPAVVIGKQRPRTFAEKVSAVDRPPLIFKRNYQFSAECASGRKGWFSMNVCQMLADDLQTDITGYKSTMYTDTATADASVSTNAFSDNARFYIDSHKEFIKMVNSSSVAITGKVHLFVHRRDTDTSYDSAPINPINLMMYYSNNARSLLTSGQGNEDTVGRGFAFNTTAGVTNYSGAYNMPGSSINAAGVTASTDPTLSPMSPQIKDRVGFWFRKISTSEFSLKPGQQFNSSFVFNLDKNKIMREQSEFNHIAGISHNIVVEFQGQIVGDSTAIGGDNVISTGSCQLSVIRENQRVLGIENKLKSKIVLQTAPLTQIAIANQVIINPDTGAATVGGTVVDA